MKQTLILIWLALGLGASPRAAAGPFYSGTAFDLVFDPDSGAVALVSKQEITRHESLRLVLCRPDGSAADKGVSCTVLDSTDAQVKVALTCSAAGQSLTGTFLVDREGEITVQPGEGAGGILVLARLAYGILPSRHLDDTIYWPKDYAPTATLHLPSENLVMGLAADGNRMLVLGWPSAGQSVTLTRDEKPGPAGGYQAIRVLAAGRDLHIGVFDVKGIWLPVDLAAVGQEKDVCLDWVRPYRARWITQLREPDSFATIEFRDGKAEVSWRAVIGRLCWPTWFDKDRAFIRLDKKIPAEGTALVYAQDGHPNTPYVFLSRSLSQEERQKAPELAKVESLFEFAVKGVDAGWNTACDGRDKMNFTILQVGAHGREQAFLLEHAQQRADRNRGPETQNRRYQAFINDMTKRLDEWTAREQGAPNTVAFLSVMRDELKALEVEFAKRMRGETADEHLAIIDALNAEIQRLVTTGGSERAVALRYLIDQINEPLNRMHSIGGTCGGVCRRWAVAAARGSAQDPVVLPYATGIRALLRTMLAYRNDESSAKATTDLR